MLNRFGHFSSRQLIDETMMIQPPEKKSKGGVWEITFRVVKMSSFKSSSKRGSRPKTRDLISSELAARPPPLNAFTTETAIEQQRELEQEQEAQVHKMRTHKDKAKGKSKGKSKGKVRESDSTQSHTDLLNKIWEERDEQMEILQRAIENRRKSKKGEGDQKDDCQLASSSCNYQTKGESAEDILLEPREEDDADDPDGLYPDFKALLRRARALTKARTHQPSPSLSSSSPPAPSTRKIWQEASKRREEEIATSIAEVGVDEAILEFESEEVKREFQEARERQVKGEKVDMKQIIDPMMREVQRRRTVLRERLLKQAAKERKEKETAAMQLIAKTEEDAAAIREDNDEWEKGRATYLERRVMQKAAPRAYMEQTVSEQREVIVREREKSDYKFVEDPGYTHAVVSLLNKKWPGVSSPKPQFVVWRLFHNYEAAETFRKMCQLYKTVEGIRNYPDGFIYIVVETNQPYLIPYSAADYGTDLGRMRIAEKTDRVVEDYYEYYELNRRRSNLEQDLSRFAALTGKGEDPEVELARREAATMQKMNLYRQRTEEIDKRQRAIEKWKLKRLLDMKKRRAYAQRLARERLAKVDTRSFRPRTQQQLDRMSEEELLEYAVLYKEAMKQRIEAAKELQRRGKLKPGDSRKMGIVLEDDHVIPMEQATEEMRPSVQFKTEDDYNQSLMDEDDVEPAGPVELDARDRETQRREMIKAGITQEYNGDFLKPDPEQQFFIGSVIYDATTREDNPEMPEAARKEHVFYIYDAFGTKEDAKQFITWSLSRMVDDMPLDIYRTCCAIAPDNIVEQDAEEYHIDGEQKRMSDAVRDMQNRVLDYHRAANGRVSVVVVDDLPAEQPEVLDLRNGGSQLRTVKEEEEEEEKEKGEEEALVRELKTSDEYMREIEDVIDEHVTTSSSGTATGQQQQQQQLRPSASSEATKAEVQKKQKVKAKLPTAAQTASILGIEVSDVTKDDRRNAKALIDKKKKEELQNIIFGNAHIST